MTLGGCASQEAYQSYTQALVDANKNRQQPGIVQEFDSTGRLVKQSILMPDQPVQVAQIKDSEWASPISMAMSLGMFGLGNWAVSHEWSSAMKSVQPNINTNTTSGGHMAGGDVSIPTTTNTSTSVDIPTTTNTSTSTMTNPTTAATGTK
jgi:hypothetical protein